MTENGRFKNIAVFIDYENFARDFDVAGVLSRLKERGRIVIKRAYGDWGRFAGAKQAMICNAVELIEVPTRSGKNHADIRLVVDAVETALTRDYVDIFVIASGDSDFIPLVAKLRELNRYVVIISSKPDKPALMAEYCDELLYYASPLTKAAAEVQSPAPSVAPKVKSAPAKTKSTPAKAAISTAPLLKMLVWATHPDLIAGRNGQSEPSPWISLSLMGNHLRRLYPALSMTEFGLPKKGGLARLAKLLQADGYLELDTSLTANKEHMIRKTEKWPVLTEADVPPAGFEDVCFNRLAHPQGYHYDRRLLEMFADHIGQLIAEFTHNGQELSVQEMMRLVKATQAEVDGGKVPDKHWQAVLRMMIAAGVVHDGRGAPLPLSKQNAVVRGCFDPTEVVGRVREFLQNGSMDPAVATAHI